jgi:hypothetical protein
VDELGAHRLLVQQFVASLLGKGLKVTQGAFVSGKHPKRLTTLDFGQGLFGFQNGQWAIQAAGVDFFVNVHDGFLVRWRLYHAGKTPVDK